MTAALRSQLAAGLVAGVVGAIVVDTFLIEAQIVAGVPAARAVVENFMYVASVPLGQQAYGMPAAPLIGLLLQSGISIAWAFGYVYLIRTRPQLLSQPWLSGAGFGLVVYVFMQIVLLAGGAYHRPASPGDLAKGLVADIVFFGIAVALVATRMLRRPGPA
jgi:hypothetical protein